MEAGDERPRSDWRALVDAVTNTQQKLLAAVEAAGVPGPWYPVLHLLLLAEDHRLPMSRLAREASITSGGFSKLADRMGREGLIDRRGSSGDRRVVYAALTTKGLEAAESAEAAYTAAFADHVLAVVEPERLRGVAQSLAGLDSSPVEDPPEEADSDGDGDGAIGMAAPRDPTLPDRRGTR